MNAPKIEKILVFCTVSTGLDAVAEVVSRGFPIAGIVGLDPSVADPIKVSGFIDVGIFAARTGVPFYHVSTYGLGAPSDRQMIESIDFELIWVAGWQRLLPKWLIDLSKWGVIGGHGSPDGVHGGRGRSPQNWALMLGCDRFDMALFRITPGVDDGPIIARRSFHYLPEDDIAVSYYKSSLAVADMMCEALLAPQTILSGTPQPPGGHYYPQRLATDGRADWSLPHDWVARHCRALTSPYPGLRTKAGDTEIIIWQCQPFDDSIDSPCGSISACFTSGDFLVSCRNGRVLVRKWEALDPGWSPRPGAILESTPFPEQLKTILERHEQKLPSQPISPRILRWVDSNNKE